MDDSLNLGSIIVAVTSIVSAFILFRTFRLQRIHFRKSLIPIIHVGYGDFEDRLIVNIKNVGLGTALVDKIEVYEDLKESKNTLYDWLPNKLPKDMDYTYYSSIYEDFAVKAGDTHVLIDIKLDKLEAPQIKVREEIRKILCRLTLKIECKDVYEMKVKTKYHKLKYFGRTDNVNSSNLEIIQS